MATGEIKALYFADGVTVVTGVAAPVGLQFALTYDGISNADQVIDVSGFTAAAETYLWGLKKPSGEQVDAVITALGGTVTVSTGDFVMLPAGSYKLVGV